MVTRLFRNVKYNGWWYSLFLLQRRLFCLFFSSFVVNVHLAFWCYRINFPVGRSQGLKASGFFLTELIQYGTCFMFDWQTTSGCLRIVENLHKVILRAGRSKVVFVPRVNGKLLVQNFFIRTRSSFFSNFSSTFSLGIFTFCSYTYWFIGAFSILQPLQ